MILRYLHTTKTQRITYGRSDELDILGYSDSDWARDQDTRKSTSDFMFIFNNWPVSWSSKKQTTVVLSSTKTEYMSLTQATKEATWLKLLITELGLQKSQNWGSTQI